MFDFPDVPALPGVPGLMRVPAGAFTSMSHGLSGTAVIMNALRGVAQNSPLAALSTIAPQIAQANGLMGGVSGNVEQYFTSMMGGFASPVGMINSGLGSITAALAVGPGSPIQSVSGIIDRTAVQASATSADFDATAFATTDLTDVESVTVTASRGGPQWGIFKDGQAVIKAESVNEFGIKKEWTISDYPVEDGGFQSFNKVYVPFSGRFRFTAGGSAETRQELLDSIDAIAGDLELYDAVMPEKTFQSVNIVSYDFRRKFDNGLGIMIIDVLVEEVRDTADAEFSTAAADPDAANAPSPAPAPKSPTAASAKSNGTQQPKAAKPTQAAKINEAINAIVPGL